MEPIPAADILSCYKYICGAIMLSLLCMCHLLMISVTKSCPHCCSATVHHNECPDWPRELCRLPVAQSNTPGTLLRLRMPQGERMIAG